MLNIRKQLKVDLEWVESHVRSKVKEIKSLVEKVIIKKVEDGLNKMEAKFGESSTALQESEGSPRKEYQLVKESDYSQHPYLVLSQDPLEVKEMRHSAPVGKSDRCILTFRFTVNKDDCSVINCDKQNFHKTDYQRPGG